MASEDENLTINNQQVILTVPASFDAAAHIIRFAAEEAGFIYTFSKNRKAYMNWLHEHEDSWRDKVLFCL